MAGTSHGFIIHYVENKNMSAIIVHEAAEMREDTAVAGEISHSHTIKHLFRHLRAFMRAGSPTDLRRTGKIAGQEAAGEVLNGTIYNRAEGNCFR